MQFIPQKHSTILFTKHELCNNYLNIYRGFQRQNWSEDFVNTDSKKGN